MDVTTAQGLDGWLAERHMQGHWKHMARVPQAKPYLWRWEDIHAGLIWHKHQNTSNGESILFAMTDRPAMEALDIYREEVE